MSKLMSLYSDTGSEMPSPFVTLLCYRKTSATNREDLSLGSCPCKARCYEVIMYKSHDVAKQQTWTVKTRGAAYCREYFV